MSDVTVFCPMCGEKIIVNGEHQRSLAITKQETYICNDVFCITKNGGMKTLAAYSGKTTNKENIKLV